jgi:hypothetical protein
MLPISSGGTRATVPARGAGVGSAALASDLDEPVVVGERAPAVGAAGADALLAQQRVQRPVRYVIDRRPDRARWA